MVGPGPTMLEGPYAGIDGSGGPVGRGVRAGAHRARKTISVIAVPVAAIVVIAVLAVMPVVMVLVVAVVPVLALPALAIESRLIFGRPHEIDRPVAGMVLMTVLTPVPGMSGRHVQVDRLRGRNAHRDGLDHDRLRGDERRRRLTADHHLAIDPRHHLSGDDRTDADCL